MADPRFSRQVRLPGWGEECQRNLAASRVLIIGAGGLGAPVTQYLAAAGLGVMGLVDDDVVSESNLQRQVLFFEEDIGKLKVDIARARLSALNSVMEIRTYPVRLNAGNAWEITKDYDLLIDCTDNFSTKFLLNDLSRKLQIPWVYGSVNGFFGQVGYFSGRSGDACYRCYQRDFPRSKIRNCEETGVLGGWVGVVGSLQATLALKLLGSRSRPDHPIYPSPSELLILDSQSSFQTRTVRIQQRADCPCCARLSDEIVLTAQEEVCGLEPGLSVADLGILLAQANPSIHLIDVRDESEWLEGSIPGAMHWPLARLREGEFPPDILGFQGMTVVFCKSGIRSSTAADLLRGKGVPQAVSLQGGIEAWRRFASG